MNFVSKNKKISFLNILIGFFASLYDLGYDFIKLLVDFFASLYDMAHDLIFFIWEYLKWITDIRPIMPQNITTQAEKSITSKS
ncbi:hypothetical protein CLU83_1520 [Flavobacterium sp. 1]|uniref:hypothetical protein n=1 Tax=Flavobacterium sp. 1 TaxID=2035200 RepID=UPI000C23D9EB|nr:hypothetical protein [Flavobacterium sp. 1]PJJ08266.1 hypothetical protein CLU83_1520 [Flavobacterium sp. 1]